MVNGINQSDSSGFWATAFINVQWMVCRFIDIRGSSMHSVAKWFNGHGSTFDAFDTERIANSAMKRKMNVGRNGKKRGHRKHLCRRIHAAIRAQVSLIEQHRTAHRLLLGRDPARWSRLFSTLVVSRLRAHAVSIWTTISWCVATAALTQLIGWTLTPAKRNEFNICV